jgi:hypothetical protein
MSLRESIDQRRAEEGYSPNPFYATKDDVTCLRVETSGGEVWILPWHHFIFGRHEAGDHERLLLTFVAHEVAMRGLNLAGLIPDVVHQRIAWLRTAPGKYLKSTGAGPSIDQIHVRPLGEPVVSE